jgi:hypothetical protein
MLRDGRDVACSLRTYPKEVLKNGKLRPVSVDRPISRCAQTWLNETTLGLALRTHPRYHEVRYERLVSNPEEEVRAVCAFIGEEFEAAMLEPDSGCKVNAPIARFINNPNAAGSINKEAVGRWRRELSLQEREQVANIAGELLVALGYATGSEWLEVARDHGHTGSYRTAESETIRPSTSSTTRSAFSNTRES